MQSNADISIDKIYIEGINDLKIHLLGKTKNEEKNIIIINDSIYNKYNFCSLNRDYVYQRITNSEKKKFHYIINIPKQIKNLKICRDSNVVFELKTSYLKLLFNHFFKTIENMFYLLSKIPIVLLKSIKKLWSRHHFIIPKQLIRKYIKTFRIRLKYQSIDDLSLDPLNNDDYHQWLSNNKKEIIIKKFNYNPLISIIIPVYNASKKELSECLDSILNQSYNNFEICIADDYSSNNETIETLKEYENNNKIRIVYRKENGNISAASNSAIKIAEGEFIALVDNDDMLDKDALYYMVQELNHNKNIDLIYTDEDKINLDGEYSYPHFKPDFSLDTFLTVNYICHFTMIRKSIVDELGGFRSEYNGAQDYDLFLRIIEKTSNITHIPKILYHWRMSPSSTALCADNKNYAYIAGKRALEDYCKRNSIDANVNLIENALMYYVDYKLAYEPKVSIIIPTKDKSDILKKCIDSIYSKTNYKNYDIIVIDNHSDEEKTKDLLKIYKSKHNNFNYYRIDDDFNYSSLNNYGVSICNGEYVLFLNNDTEVITPDWLKNMVAYASQKHIGCVGVKLLYPNKTVQHCGVVTGVGGVATHANCYAMQQDLGYFGRLIGVYDWSCVTAACLMIKKEKFNEVEGFDEKIKVAFNDVDLCLKVIEKGYYNVVLPNVQLFHHESLTRGSDLDLSKRQRVEQEVNYMCDKWGKTLLNDKYYNVNFSKDYAFRLDKE